ncbi:MAG: phosphoribosylaminoimidazolesuccinocarboxamide synthase [Acidimicrobiia bacterium]
MRDSRGGLKHLHSGKVRDLYEVDEDFLLMVASDRVSVYDVILDDLIPNKGKMLTEISEYWFHQTASIVPNHLVTTDVATAVPGVPEDFVGRSMLVRRLHPVKLECVARGYLFGSAWSAYQEDGSAYGRQLPNGMRLAERFDEPIFTATTKADVGHDEPLTDAEAAELVGHELFEILSELTLQVYQHLADHSAARGIILADTKLEFGLTNDGELLLMDEVGTPDSSRYWPAETWVPGSSPPSFDKQFVRDYVDSIGWDHTPPPPPLPAEVVAGTASRYEEVVRKLTAPTL